MEKIESEYITQATKVSKVLHHSSVGAITENNNSAEAGNRTANVS
jgi:hypothetical protein